MSFDQCRSTSGRPTIYLKNGGSILMQKGKGKAIPVQKLRVPGG